MPIMMTVCSFAGKDTSGVFGSFGIVLVLTILLGYMVWFGIERVSCCVTPPKRMFRQVNEHRGKVNISVLTEIAYAVRFLNGRNT